MHVAQRADHFGIPDTRLFQFQSLRGFMTRDDIIQLARECGMWGEIEYYSHGVMLSELIRFTRLVQAWENEACAAIAYEYGAWNQTAQDIGDEIRNRYAETTHAARPVHADA